MRVRRFERNILYTIITFGLLIRIYHLYKWRIWGSDSGEYLYRTRYLVKHGQMLTENYIGWGRAYPDFQGMQLLTGSISLITGISYHETLLWFIPLIAGLSVPMLFILGKKMVGFKAALFGSAFYSLTFALVYAN